MSNRRRENLQEIVPVTLSGLLGLGVMVLTSVLLVAFGPRILEVLGGTIGHIDRFVDSYGLVLLGAVFGFGDVALGVSVWVRRRGSQSPAGHRTVSTVAAGSLRWVCGLLPGDEGTAWWAEVTSLLAEAPDKSTRRRYVRSYLRNVPRLIWTSWSEYLSASRRRELS